MMTEIERIRFQVVVELDAFISSIREEGAIENKDVRAFIRDVVIPRLTTLRVIVNTCSTEFP